MFIFFSRSWNIWFELAAFQSFNWCFRSLGLWSSSRPHRITINIFILGWMSFLRDIVFLLQKRIRLLFWCYFVLLAVTTTLSRLAPFMVMMLVMSRISTTTLDGCLTATHLLFKLLLRTFPNGTRIQIIFVVVRVLWVTLRIPIHTITIIYTIKRVSLCKNFSPLSIWVLLG